MLKQALVPLFALLFSRLNSPQGPEILRVWDVGVFELGLMPDIDGDGDPELLAGNSAFSLPGITTTGVLRVLSSSGPVLFEHFGTVAHQAFGTYSAAVGDVNGDGLSDYMVSGGRGQAQVFSGQDGSLLFSHTSFAQDAAPLGDVDEDGFGDFLLGSGNRVFFYRGGSFELRARIVPPNGTASFGQKIVSMGDVDGDGFPDFAVGAPGCGCFKEGPPGEVFVYSGREARRLYRLVGPTPSDEFGRTLEAPGDLTGDGIVDLAVGAYRCCSDEEGPGRIYFHDGKTGAFLRFVEGRFAASHLASRMDALGDLNGNGFADVLATMLRLGGYSSLAIDGSTGRVTYEYDFGEADVAGGGHDWNEDGFPDFLVNLPFPPRVELRSGAPPGTQVLGQPCGSILGQAPRIGATGVPELGQDYALHLTDIPGDVPAMLHISVLGPTQSPIPGLRGCDFLSQASARFRVTTQKIAPGRGAATVVLPIPAKPALQGLHFFAQWTILDPRGLPLALTRILRPTIGG
jgi:hypothetical protein